VKFLVDINLPPRLCLWLREHGHEANHLCDLNALTMADKRVWQFAATRQEIIVSKDVDFYERALVLGKPPQVLHISVGNCSNDDLLGTLAASWSAIESELSAGALGQRPSKSAGSFRVESPPPPG